MWSNCFCFVLVTSSWLDSQSFKIVWKFYLCAAPYRDVNKPQNCFLSYIWLFFIIYQILLLTRHVILQAGRQLLVKLIFSDLTSTQQSVCRQSRHQVNQMTSAMFATRLRILFLNEQLTHSSVIASFTWLWLWPADSHAHLQLPVA